MLRLSIRWHVRLLFFFLFIFRCWWVHLFVMSVHLVSMFVFLLAGRARQQRRARGAVRRGRHPAPGAGRGVGRRRDRAHWPRPHRGILKKERKKRRQEARHSWCFPKNSGETRRDHGFAPLRNQKFKKKQADIINLPSIFRCLVWSFGWSQLAVCPLTRAHPRCSRPTSRCWQTAANQSPSRTWATTLSTPKAVGGPSFVYTRRAHVGPRVELGSLLHGGTFGV